MWVHQEGPISTANEDSHIAGGGWPIHMNHQTLVPEPFGPLFSLKIVSTGILIAQPYAAVLCAENGRGGNPG
jgi:hypothetical protein